MTLSRPSRGESLASGSADHHVEAGATNLSGIERRDQSGLVDQRTARRVHDVGALFHLGEDSGVHHAARLPA